MRFEWDFPKNRQNIEKHGISFEEASALLLESANYMEIFDAAHSDEEDRYFAIGRIARGIIVLVFTEGDDEAVRVISARVATRGERRRYEAWKVGAID